MYAARGQTSDMAGHHAYHTLCPILLRAVSSLNQGSWNEWGCLRANRLQQVVNASIVRREDEPAGAREAREAIPRKRVQGTVSRII